MMKVIGFLVAVYGALILACGIGHAITSAWDAAGLHGASLVVVSSITSFVLTTAVLHAPRVIRWLRNMAAARTLRGTKERT